MKYIIKKASPEQFEKWKNYKRPSKWSDFDGNPVPIEKREEKAEYYSKHELRQYLLEEQGATCCYCEMRIENDPLGAKIEHIEPREGDTQTERIFDYANLSLSCNGGERDPKPKILHCDTHKKAKPIPFSHLEMRCEQELSFPLNGTIIGLTDDGKKVIKTLNLSIPKLNNLRDDAIAGYIYTDQDKTKLITSKERQLLLDHLKKANDLPFKTSILSALRQL